MNILSFLSLPGFNSFPETFPQALKYEIPEINEMPCSQINLFPDFIHPDLK